MILSHPHVKGKGGSEGQTCPIINPLKEITCNILVGGVEIGTNNYLGLLYRAPVEGSTSYDWPSRLFHLRWEGTFTIWHRECGGGLGNPESLEYSLLLRFLAAINLK